MQPPLPSSLTVNFSLTYDLLSIFFNSPSSLPPSPKTFLSISYSCQLLCPLSLSLSLPQTSCTIVQFSKFPSPLRFPSLTQLVYVFVRLSVLFLSVYVSISLLLCLSISLISNVPPPSHFLKHSVLSSQSPKTYSLNLIQPFLLLSPILPIYLQFPIAHPVLLSNSPTFSLSLCLPFHCFLIIQVTTHSLSFSNCHFSLRLS